MDDKLNTYQWPTIAVLILLVATITGCEFLGPRALRGGRTDYNEAIRATEAEQLLLNIVRLRFSDEPYFLQIASISSTAELAASLGGKSTFNDIDENTIEGGLSYLERPTIIYQPLTGEKFVRQLLEPIDLNTIMLLRLAGWELDDIMRVFVNRINGVPNAPTGGDSTPEGIPEFEEFIKIVESMDELEDAGAMILGASGKGEVDELVIFTPQEEDLPEQLYLELESMAKALNLDPDAEQIRMRIGLGKGGKDEIIIETRPIISAMFYIGQSIEIPEEIIKKGTVNINLDETGRPFDWQKVHKGLIFIRSSKERPRNAYVSVPYKGYWYYIPESDIDSKETLTMLKIVLTLKAGGIPSTGPVLTLDVGG